LAKRKAEAEVKAGEAQRLGADLERVRREMQQQIDTLKSDQAQSNDGRVTSLQQQLDQLRHQFDGERKKLESELSAAKSGASARSSEAEKELARLREEIKQLETGLAEAEEKAKVSAVVGETSQEVEDLRRRFELAVEDVRELKNKNADLTDQLARAKSSAGAPAADGAMDWEAQKRKMLEQLESDFDEKVEQDKADKMTVQGAIKITDQVVADKEQEIQELRRLLENQSQNVGEVAVGAAAIAQALDSDEIVRQERENLQQLQSKLREEHKKAEVECSLERAKVARERAELEEKLRQFEAEKASLGVVEPGVGGHEKGKKGGGKWLARLGLGAGGDKHQ
jgi:hypothetical protein